MTDRKEKREDGSDISVFVSVVVPDQTVPADSSAQIINGTVRPSKVEGSRGGSPGAPGAPGLSVPSEN